MIGDAHAVGTTPLDPDEAAALLPRHIATQGQLNEWEQANILAAVQWAAAARTKVDLLTDTFVRELHRRMFDRTWRWAGRYRQSDKNIGIAWAQVPMRVRDLLADTRFWVDHTTYPSVEIAVRLHHRLVATHPFSNGNGRHARLMADLVLTNLGGSQLPWGRNDLTQESEIRARYIDALNRADAGDIAPLLAFAQGG